MPSITSSIKGLCESLIRTSLANALSMTDSGNGNFKDFLKSVDSVSKKIGKEMVDKINLSFDSTWVKLMGESANTSLIKIWDETAKVARPGTPEFKKIFLKLKRDAFDEFKKRCDEVIRLGEDKYGHGMSEVDPNFKPAGTHDPIRKYSNDSAEDNWTKVKNTQKKINTAMTSYMGIDKGTVKFACIVFGAYIGLISFIISGAYILTAADMGISKILGVMKECFKKTMSNIKNLFSSGDILSGIVEAVLGPWKVVTNTFSKLLNDVQSNETKIALNAMVFGLFAMIISAVVYYFITKDEKE